MSESDVVVDVDVDQAIKDLVRWRKQWKQSMEGAATDAKKTGDKASAALNKSSKSMKKAEQSALSMEKVMEKFQSQLIEKFITIELAFRAFSFAMRELAENSKEIQKLGEAFGKLSDNFFAASTASGTMVSAIDSVTAAVNRLAAAYDTTSNIQKAVLSNAELGILDETPQQARERRLREASANEAAELNRNAAKSAGLLARFQRRSSEIDRASSSRRQRRNQIAQQQGNLTGLSFGDDFFGPSGGFGGGPDAGAGPGFGDFAGGGAAVSGLGFLEGIDTGVLDSIKTMQQAEADFQKFEQETLDKRAEAWANTNDKIANIREKEEKEFNEFGASMAAMGASLSGELVGTLTNAFVEIAKGNEVALDKILGDLFTSMGTRLLVEGTTALVSAGINAAFGNPASVAQFAAGGAALAAGATLLAGGIPLAAAAAGGGGGASPGLGAGRGIGGGSSGSGAREVRDAPININIAGNVLGADEAEFGVVVTRAIRAAKARG